MSLKKSLLWLLLFVLPVLFPGKAAAYNEDSRFHFEALFEYLTRDIREDNTQFAGENFPETTSSAQSLRLLGKLSLRIVDPLEIYGLAGGSNLDVDDFHFHSDFSGAYGGGVRVVLFRERDPRRPYQVFADYRFLQFKANDSVLFDPTIIDNAGNAVHLLPPSGESVQERIRWQEHTVKLGFMARDYEFEPYGGVRFSLVKGRDHIPTSVQKLNIKVNQDDIFGVFLGTSYYLTPSDKAALFVEGSLFDQYSISGGFRVGF
ncbi:MAG: hypothetical protein HY282_11615 [Nitrospirae bacterium]|nr:hypothetical protein [Candidatus Manganitrophaceae bacterium]